MRIATKGLLAAGVLLAGGAVEVGVHFHNDDSEWTWVGLSALILGILMAVCAYFARNRHHLDDAYEAGFASGMHKGQRIRPKVIRLERDRVPSSHR